LPASGLKVLVIEDERDVSIYMANLLRANGFTPITASGSAEGLSKARSDKPVLIIMDAMLPGDESRELFYRLRTNPELNKIPVVLLSSISRRALAGFKRYSADSSKKLLREPEAFLYKPPEAEDFMDVVRRLAPVSIHASKEEGL
jgi:CheY-like chemotaxis protein